jgi:ubiquitin C-terminal hydrolase
VDIPLSFSISSELGGQHTYELSSVCNHLGSLNGGHYTAQVKINDAWTLVDDDAFAPSANFSNAYCLFYERV